jgi:hypothetical protein
MVDCIIYELVISYNRELNQGVSDDPLRKLVKSTCLIAVLNDEVDGA